MTSLIIPTVAKLLNKVTDKDILPISRGISMILLVVYINFLYFQLGSHAQMFNEPSPKVLKRRSSHQEGDVKRNLAAIGAGLTSMGNEAKQVVPPRSAELEGETLGQEVPQLSVITLILSLPLATTVLAFNTSFATDSLNGMIEATGLSITFVGIVLLPLLSNDFTVVRPAMKDEMSLSVALTVGKCLQTTLLVIPFVVILGWMMGVDLELSFDGFEVAALFASVLYINSMIAEGKSN